MNPHIRTSAHPQKKTAVRPDQNLNLSSEVLLLLLRHDADIRLFDGDRDLGRVVNCAVNAAKGAFPKGRVDREVGRDQQEIVEWSEAGNIGVGVGGAGTACDLGRIVWGDIGWEHIGVQEGVLLCGA